MVRARDPGFDYGAPVGFRLALAHPERVTAIITQNDNAYEEGLSNAWNPIQKYWQEPSEANRTALRELAVRRFIRTAPSEAARGARQFLARLGCRTATTRCSRGSTWSSGSTSGT